MFFDGIVNKFLLDAMNQFSVWEWTFNHISYYRYLFFL